MEGRAFFAGVCESWEKSWFLCGDSWSLRGESVVTTRSFFGGSKFAAFENKSVEIR
jgi:hypothetical protein